jgi:hypothetical protein
MDVAAETSELAVPVRNRLADGRDSWIGRRAEYGDSQPDTRSGVLERGGVDATGLTARDRAEKRHHRDQAAHARVSHDDYVGIVDRALYSTRSQRFPYRSSNTATVP